MSVKGLLAALIAFAVLLAPAMTRFGQANAAVPDHHAQMMAKGHCDPAPGGDQDNSADSSCCFQLCMAVAAEPVTPSAINPVLRSANTAALHRFPVGAPDELATPPPRAA